MTLRPSKAPQWALAGLFILFAWMIVFNIRPIQDPDVWWHLGSGRYMVNHASIPKTDVFSLTAQGTPWINSYWLQEIVEYGFYRAIGINGLILLNATLIALLVTLIACINPAGPLPWPTRLLGIVWIFMACHPRSFGWGEKASLISFGFLALLFYWIKRDHWKRGMVLWPLLFILWANMHRGFIMGLGILALFVIEKIYRNPEQRLRLGVWWSTCVVATLVNPWGIGIYGMGWSDVRQSPGLVNGWASTPFHHLELFWVTLVIFWIFVIWAIQTEEKPSVAFIVTSLILSYLSVRYASFYRYFIMWSVPWLLAMLSQYSKLLSSSKLLPAILGIAGLLSLSLRPAFGINGKLFPTEAVQFLISSGLRIPFFHEYEIGGYYLWALEGKPPVLIDGRFPAVKGYQSLYPRIHQVLGESPIEFDRFLTSLNLHCAVVKYPTTHYVPNPFTTYFPRQKWGLIYWDDTVLVFVQRRPETKDYLKQYEFKGIAPDTHPLYWKNVYWPKLAPALKAEIHQEALRNARLHPNSGRTQLWVELTKP